MSESKEEKVYCRGCKYYQHKKLDKSQTSSENHLCHHPDLMISFSHGLEPIETVSINTLNNCMFKVPTLWERVKGVIS